MKRLMISEPESIILGIQDEMRKSPEARYDHRLHGILLVAQGMSCRQVGHLLGDSPRTVQYRKLSSTLKQPQFSISEQFECFAQVSRWVYPDGFW